MKKEDIESAFAGNKEKPKDNDVSPKLSSQALLTKKIDDAILKMHASRGKLAVFFLDLDNFKKINHGYGYDVGNELFAEVISRLNSAQSQDQLAISIGGDKSFLVFTHLKSQKAITKLANHLLKKIAHVYFIQTQQFYITTSIGISIYPQHGKDAMTLLKKADFALSKAKELGGNNYQFAASNSLRLAKQKIKLENALHQAVEKKQFIMHYQPIFDMTTKKIVRLEALVRWKTSGGKLKYPDDFLPFAEEFKLMEKLSKLVIDNTLRFLHQLKKLGFYSCEMAINLSAGQLNMRHIQFLKKKILEYAIPTDSITIELTEKNLLQLTNQTAEVFKELHQMKIKLSIDDFGIGFSALSYLKQFPIDNLKIDKLFIAGVPNKPKSVAIVSAILAMAASLDISVTAEGVEREEQLKFLKESGCPEYQGIYLSPPLSEKDIISSLSLLAKLE